MGKNIDDVFRVTISDIKKVNQKIIDDSKFKQSNPILYKIKKYFKKPTHFKVSINENQVEKSPNFYIDVLGYEQKQINLTAKDINHAYQKAVEKYNKK